MQWCEEGAWKPLGKTTAARLVLGAAGSVMVCDTGSSVLNEAVTCFAAVGAAGAPHPTPVLSSWFVANLDLSSFAEKH